MYFRNWTHISTYFQNKVAPLILLSQADQNSSVNKTVSTKFKHLWHSLKYWIIYYKHVTYVGMFSTGQGLTLLCKMALSLCPALS